MTTADQRDLSLHMAEFFANVRYEDLPPDAVEGAKKSILDSFGICLAASGREPAAQALVEFVLESGGKPESSVFGYGGKVPAVMAALANGAMIHSLDYDDQTPWGQHSGLTLLPAVFAAAERRGGVSGKEMITAVAAGQDMFNRLRRHVDWRKDWNFSTVMGVFCATAAAGRILGLDSHRIAQAIGIASMQCCGTMEVIYSTGSDMRAMYAGFPAKGAVLAAVLAERDISGVPAVLEGNHGILTMYFGGRYDRVAILEDLGRTFTGGLTLYKRWPAVGTSHSHIHATIRLMVENDLTYTDVAEIRVHVGDYHQIMCAPLDTRRAPQTLVDAKFSLPFLVAIAAVNRDMRLAHFTEAAIRQPEVLAVAQKVTPIVDPSLDWKLDLPPGRVDIITQDGRMFSMVGTAIPGSAENPMTWEDILRKFADCTEASIKPWSQAQIVEAGNLAQSLEAAPDATALLRLQP